MESQNLAYTPQEHKLFGSTTRITPGSREYFIPLGVVEGKCSLEECKAYRETNPTLRNVLIINYLDLMGMGIVRISPLNMDIRSPDYGTSLEDPILMEITGKFYRLSDRGGSKKNTLIWRVQSPPIDKGLIKKLKKMGAIDDVEIRGRLSKRKR